ncbi:terminase small subunit [Pectobacterium brasiliense]|uniref:terminase small subunit n=1 Tax=Pectobacterium brasiliense TaxID=180957 RepID=UPI00202D767D|nr:terminase small subunit [Pectobacterium brasiliense]MCL6376766.1 terminase small subunit [Pectobacterium brasiliense]
MASKKLTAEQQKIFDVLTPLQKRFVTLLLKGKSQVDAYRKAGGKAKGDSAHSKATQIVRNSKVESFLASVQYEAVSSAIMTYEEAMERLTAMGRTSIADLATFGTHVVGEDDDGNPISQSVWSFKNSGELKPEQMAAISELTAGKDGLKIKLHDPKAAIKQLAEMRGWEAPKKTEVTATVKSENVNMTPEEAAEAYKKLMG